MFGHNDQYADKRKKGNGTGTGENIFLKIEPGKPVKGTPQGEPYVFYSHWLGMGKGSAVCSGEFCPHCNSGQIPWMRIRTNFIQLVNGAFTAKIWEFSGMVDKSLAAIEATLEKPLSDFTVSITRTGTGKKDTAYTIVPISPLSEETKAMLKTIKLLDLVPKAKSDDIA